MSAPKITIVTPSYNQGQYLEETIRSILDQGYPNLELIIIDGGSTDNSVDVIRKYETHLAYWVSEKDHGQTHAINKGFERSTGEILNWINSDDLLAPGALSRVAEIFSREKPLCVCGGVTIFDNERSWSYPPAWAHGESLQEVIARDHYNQPGTFFSREALLGAGYPDENLNYIMDKEWFIRFLLKFGTSRIALTPEVLALHRYHDTSKTIAQGNRFLDEYAAIISSMADSIGEKEFRPLLSEKYDFSRHPYRFDPAFGVPGKAVIHQMTAVLLFRRFHRIYTKTDFDFAARMLSVIRPGLLKMDAELEEHFRAIRKQVGMGSWLLFRLRRKLHLQA